MNYTRPQLAIVLDPIRHAFVHAKNRGIRLRYLTEITTENISYLSFPDNSCASIAFVIKNDKSARINSDKMTRVIFGLLKIAVLLLYSSSRLLSRNAHKSLSYS